MSGVVRRLEWARQPQGTVGVNWANPIARGLVKALIPGISPIDAVTEENGSPYLYDIKIFNDELTRLESGLTSSHLSVLTTKWSVALRFRGRDPFGAQTPIFLRGPSGLGLTFYATHSLGAYSGAFTSGSGYQIIGKPTGGSLVYDTDYIVGASADETSGSVYHNGINTGSSSSLGTPDVTGSLDFGGTALYVSWFFLWNRKLTDAEQKSVYENPWQLFEPEQVNVPMAGGGGGPAALAGAATAGASATGALSTAIPILGAAVSGATASGSLSTAISLAGASATISASAAGNLSATIRLAGDAVAGALAAGGLTTDIPLAGGGSVGGAGTGDLSTGSGLAGAGAAGAAGTGVLTTQITLSGAAIAQAIASGALTTTPAGLAGDGTSSSSGSGALSTAIPLAGAAAVSVVGTGGLVTAIPLAGAATVAVSATGDLVVSLGLAGAALISAIGSGALLTSITLNGAAVTGAVGAGALSGAALHASPWRTVTSLARVRSVRATARVRRCIAGVR